MNDFVCPYEKEYNKLSEEQKNLFPKPCGTEDCVLNPVICRERLIRAYEWSERNKNKK